MGYLLEEIVIGERPAGFLTPTILQDSLYKCYRITLSKFGKHKRKNYFTE